jgi:hypothetical protein
MKESAGLVPRPDEPGSVIKVGCLQAAGPLGVAGGYKADRACRFAAGLTNPALQLCGFV